MVGRRLLWLWSSALLGCSSIVGFDDLTFVHRDASVVESGADGGVPPASTADSAISPSPPSQVDLGVLPDAATTPPPPSPLDGSAPPPPPAPCWGATGHRVVRADPGAVLEGSCSHPTSPSVQDDPMIQLDSWMLDGVTCAFTRVRSANHGSSGWTSTETGFYTSPLDSEGEARVEQWENVGGTRCVRRQLYRWTDIED